MKVTIRDLKFWKAVKAPTPGWAMRKGMAREDAMRLLDHCINCHAGIPFDRLDAYNLLNRLRRCRIEGQPIEAFLDTCVKTAPPDPPVEGDFGLPTYRRSAYARRWLKRMRKKPVVPSFRIVHVCGNWYADGLEKSPFGRENLWRLDFTEPGKPPVQVQLFATTQSESRQAIRYQSFRVVIERDQRTDDGDTRIDYAFDGWDLTKDQGLTLLSAGTATVIHLLRDKLDHVYALPCKKEFLFKSRRYRLGSGKPVPHPVAEPAPKAAAEAIEPALAPAWQEMERLIRVNAKHRSGFFLQEVSSAFILDRLVREVNELIDNPTDITEVADILGVVFHYAIKRGWALIDIEVALLEKLRSRFSTH